ncbi:MAG: hypothetical protein IH947_03870 [Bacteroidetes bacterium]|nr:hypothetical protein [Bacteroidota bacterium]
MKKSKVIETLGSMPEEFSADELIDRIIFIDKVEKGLQDVEEGKTYSLQEVKDKLNQKWLK